MESEDRLSTRDIASGGSSGADRDAAVADAPPADTAAVPDERVDRDDDAARSDTEGESGAVSSDEVPAGEPVTDEPVASEDEATSARGPSRESIAGDGDTTADADAGRDTTAGDTAPAPAAAAAASGTSGGDADARTSDTTTGTASSSGMGGASGGTRDDEESPSELIPDSESLQSRWEEIQVRFVDEPRGAGEDADALVATVMQRLAEGFAQERETLEAQWGRGEDISTEDLRVALQRYRSFFRRLLST